MKAFVKVVVAMITTALLSAPVFALDLQEAKNQGLVGEMPTGYLGSVSANPSEDVQALIADINGKRNAKYQQLAKSQGVPLEAVEKLAGEKAFEKTASGHYVKLPGGSWQKK